ncbi:efflux pump antibiotic resistance [Fusarium austroafricanum]|uniref:Efflux pump antibiotic resistance n=1 Tax=Fusarium austroafricanum TaxID=2364996 RepID=A0A8H4KG86_9HYPO|nr:efflux pump antibiotic resistance [Fusarium austroafricanum]
MASGLFSNFSPWHIPAVFLGTTFTLGGLLPLRAPERAMREYGLPEGIVKSEPAQLAFGIYGSRVAAYGVALWTFYLRGEYHVVDTLLSLLFWWGTADLWICIKSGVPRTVPQMTTSPPITPPIIAPRFVEEPTDDELSSEELLLASAEVLCTVCVVLNVVSLETTDEVFDV